MNILISLLELAFFILVLYLIADIFAIVPKVNFGVVERFGGRLKGHRPEGLNFKIPLIDKISFYSTELVETEVPTSFTTQDKLGLEANGTLQYRADPKIVDENDRSVFVGISNRVICRGVSEAVQSLLGALGGVNDHTNFITKRQILEDIINCKLRMKTPPHMRHKSLCEEEGCPFHELDQIPTERLIEFYDEHWRAIRPMIQEKRRSKKQEDQEEPSPARETTDDSFSDIEQRYGITIVYFALPKVDFTPETKRALEEKKQAEFRELAGKIRIELVKAYIAVGLTPKEAADQADLVLDETVNKLILSTQGDLGLIGPFIPGILDKVVGGRKEK